MWTTENTSTHDRCESHSDITDRRCTTHLCLVMQVCSVLLHQLPHQVKVTSCCWHQDSCLASLWRWDLHIHNSPCLCIRQYRPDTSVVSTALQYWNIRPSHFRCGWWTLDYTHIGLFVQRGSELVVEHPYYLSMATASCLQQGRVAPLCKKEDCHDVCGCSHAYVCVRCVCHEYHWSRGRGRLAC